MTGLIWAVLRVLWLVAGGAMLLFVLFVAFLFVAGCGFRLGPRRRRRKPAVVLPAALIVVLLPAGLLVVPGRIPDPRAEVAAESVGGGAGERFPARCDGGDRAPRLPARRTVPARAAAKAVTGTGIAGTSSRALVLYDEPGDADASVQKLANLVSRFGPWAAHPVGDYRAGEMDRYAAVFYLGTAGGESLPDAFLDDVRTARRPVVWINENLQQLWAGSPAWWTKRFGFTPLDGEATGISRVDYKGTTLTRDPADGAGVARVRIDRRSKAAVLATAAPAGGRPVPWAVRSGQLIYVGENPLRQMTDLNGRYLAFADLLFDALAPATPARHRALVRLEDIGPTADPVKLRKIADYLSSRRVPFSFSVFPVYRDPNGVGGKATTIRLSERPEVVRAIKYLTSCGGTMVMHGYTHQHEQKHNPHSGQSGADFEFYLAHLDERKALQLDGPVPGDSVPWALDRIDRGLAEFRAAGLTPPQVFEFPHYAGSADDYRAVATRFPYRYERSLYFPGLLSGGPVQDAGRAWQFFPYPVRDVYGATVIPENLDYYVPVGSQRPHGVDEIVDTARRNLVVRDGVASFFYHPELGLGELPRIVDGIRELGYTFVSAHEVVASP